LDVAEAAPTVPKDVPEDVAEAKQSEVVKDKGTLAGAVTYPWGIVKGAKVLIGEKSVSSDSEGKYEVSLLEPGSYNITAEAPFPGYEAAPQKVELLAGETKTVNIHLDFKKAIVEGYVYDNEGKPISGAVLSGVLSGKDMDKVTTDERGYFRFARVTPGDRFVRVNARGFMGQTLDFTAKEMEPVSLEFRLLPANCTIQGKVVDSTGKPIQAEVLLLSKGVVNQKTISEAGTGRFEFYALPGFYEVLAVAAGYQTKGWTGTISADQKVDFRLETIPEDYVPPA
jgi:hypothetical protein